MPALLRTGPLHTTAVLAPAAAWAYLALARGRFWSTATGLPAVPPPPEGHRWPPLAVVVPARNESELLPHTLPRLLAQDYRGPVHVVLVDDRSADGTAGLARAIGRQNSGVTLTVLEGGPLPAGWAGKPWAMAQGVEAALRHEPRPEWLLFTDADISHPPGSLAALVWAAQADRRKAVSLMARLAAEDTWEKLLMPAFVYFFAQIYPFNWVNDRRRATAAAAGGCLLVEAAALEAAGGIDAIADRVIDDVALAQALAGTGANLWLGLAASAGPGGSGKAAPEVQSLRRYPELGDIWDMVARSAYTQLRTNPLLLAGALAGLGALYLAPPAMALAGLRGLSRQGALARLKGHHGPGRRLLLAASGLAAWTTMAATYLPTVRYYRVPPVVALCLPFTASLYMAMTISSALRSRRGAVLWR